jgi:hypothetical protein
MAAKKRRKRAGGITKVEAVRQAVAALGPSSKPLQFQEWIKNNLKIDMGTDHISTCLGAIRKSLGGKRGRPRKAAKAGRPAKLPVQASAARRPSAHTNGIILQDLETLKGLAERIDARTLHKLIDVITG